MKKGYCVIIGAGSEIAKAIALQTLGQQESPLIVIGRNLQFYRDKLPLKACITMPDYSESSIENAVAQIKNTVDSHVSNVFICNGKLHDESIVPEKKFEDFNQEQFLALLGVNSIVPMIWIKHLTPMCKGSQACKVVVFSARVGSIGDNNLGGWYSYRASKAALNMLLKSAAVELARRAKNMKLIAFHPGTTDSPLSKPFQHNVSPDKLFSAKFVANKLIELVKKTGADGQLSYLDWQGKTIEW